MPFPTREQVLDFIRTSPTPVGKREIARAFHLRGQDRIPLKALLKELEQEGAVDRGHAKRLAASGALPEVTVIQIIGPDADGDIWARPIDFPEDDAEPQIVVIEDKKLDRPLAAGDRVLARLERTDADVYEARPIRRLQARAERVVGVFEKGPHGAGRLIPSSKRVKTEFIVEPRDINNARPEEIVVAEVEPARRLGQPKARIIERIGRVGEPKAVSIISIAEHHIPFQFSPAALEQAENAGPAPLGDRTDLRQVPLVTIDGDDARDFDDAVWAAPDDNPKNPGGWRIIVAIADVAWYVRPGDALDRNAWERGNSVYFPDRVVPMLPEELSNGWCSLRPHEERPVMAVEMTIDAAGQKLHHRFMRGLMRSAARLTYEQVQAAVDGNPNDLTEPLLGPVIRPLYGAFQALLKAREARGTLELDLPERRVFITQDGRIDRIVARERLDSHRLIEEFMIAANVAAAEALEKKRWPCMYRVHDRPDESRIEALREFLDTLDLRLAKGQVLRPKHFTQLLGQARDTPFAEMISTLVLRSQSQAVYAPENLGHFGLALQRYAHFTSPIRRYADLLVHRALIGAYEFGEGALEKVAAKEFAETGIHISATERRAAAAERDAIDRYVAAFLADRVDAEFEGRISGVARFGLFINLRETGADGIVPISTLPNDFYDHDEGRHALVGRRSGRIFQLGQSVTVRLVAADALTGGITLELLAAEPLGATAATTARRANPPGRHGRTPGVKAPPRKGGKPTQRGRAPQGKTGNGGKTGKGRKPAKKRR
ncbi:RNAse R [Dongia mobilis]|uniref:Ribonuclease R n=1 Tax=Dongia mobilis TaxID=578943 RepID=A0A4R6WNP3_9PROT|nr:ribonuclease R [Dongia mobilis]TDQ80580.1 RNAse R [Dongia mobilis]